MKKFLLNSYLVILLTTALIISYNSTGVSVFTLISFTACISVYILLFSITGRLLCTIALGSSVIIVLQIINQLKIHFYKERLLSPDIYLALDSDNLEVLLHYPMALLATILIIIFITINTLLFWSKPQLSLSTRVSALFLAIFTFYYAISLSQNKKYIDRWEAHLPKGRGTIVNLFMSAQKSSYQAPIYHESANYFIQQPNVDNNRLTYKPDIIAFLQESTISPILFPFKQDNLPELAMFKPTSQTIANSLLRVETYGGGTWLTEFSLLTGLNSNDFSFRKNAVFYKVTPHIQASLFKELKNNGYFTVVLTPMQEQNYNAGNAYHDLGIDLILRPQTLGYPADVTKNLWHIPSKEMLAYVKKIMETYTNKPLFIFVLSMNEHGPYDKNHPDKLMLSPIIGDKNFINRFNHYFEKIESLNQATLDFSHYLMHRGKPSLFLYFGDHHPDLGWKGSYQTTLANGQYLTQYLLQSYGYPIFPLTNIGPVTDIAFLGGLLLETINADISPFYKANIKMRHLCQGRLIDCSDQQLVNSYKNYVYQIIKNAGN